MQAKNNPEEVERKRRLVGELLRQTFFFNSARSGQFLAVSLYKMFIFAVQKLLGYMLNKRGIIIKYVYYIINIGILLLIEHGDNFGARKHVDRYSSSENRKFLGTRCLLQPVTRCNLAKLLIRYFACFSRVLGNGDTSL